MNRGIYAAATAMIANERWLEVLTHNLANVSTTGFKREGIVFNEALLRSLEDPAGEGRTVGTLGSGPIPGRTFTIFEMGNFITTGNALDVAINTERGLFAVQTPQGVRFTRDGSFSLTERGELVTKQGYPVLDRDLRPIVLPPGIPHIGSDGLVVVDERPIAQLGVFDGPMTRSGAGLFSCDSPRLLEGAEIKPETLESSNVDPIESMIGMIKLSRHFEFAQRTIQTQDETTQKLIQSLNQQ